MCVILVAWVTFQTGETRRYVIDPCTPATYCAQAKDRLNESYHLHDYPVVFECEVEL